MTKFEPSEFWKTLLATYVGYAIIALVVLLLVWAAESLWEYLEATWRPL